MSRKRPEVGQFVRVSEWAMEMLPAAIWGVVEWVNADGSHLDVRIFLGVEIAQLKIASSADRQNVLMSSKDKFRVFTIDKLPQYALAAWVKNQLTKGSD